ncbi:DUF411 domain-containing protein [Methylococcus sp. EFPC2]|uniref:DUF411 domain-containing protein n=1 Tax=Methylococcus sp. EFPC2 TaxID=2812648 RepID=UPI001967EA8C|nr:DUF411 domain-containing protein [Methylococcus sp. EFPC2]QSA97175.1 DUF411 domain-containing protein [Methylococcus sp. EFPC2]
MKKILSAPILFTFLSPAWAGSVWDQPTEALAKPVEMTVYRSPTCGCCGQWIEHMKKQGFVIKDIKREDMDALKKQLGIPSELQSCHTAKVGDYVIEGHVPAADVKKLLKEKSALAGLTVPGMVAGSPGMEVGGNKQAFEVVGFDKTGKAAPVKTYDRY